jgi:hypothetical protein
MKKPKLFFMLTLVAMLSFGSVVMVYADAYSDETCDDSSEQYIHGEICIVRGEVLEWRYAYVQGIYCKRRWSLTSNCWYDPYWIPV